MLTPPPPLSRHAPITLHHDQIGRGPAVLVIPGFGCANWIFKPLAETLGDRFSFVLPDLPGMGASADPGLDYDFETLADLLDDLMQRNGFHRYHVIGISMGGFIAQKLMLRCPSSVQRCVLMATSAAHADIEPITLITEAQLRAMYDLEPAAMVHANTDATVHPDFARRAPAAYQSLRNHRLQHVASFVSLQRQRRAVARYFESPVPLHLITNPVLLLTGDADRLVPPRHATQLAKLLPNAEVRQVADSDHWFFWERHQQTAAAIATFLV